MHPSLRIENINRLPPTLRRRAYAAFDLSQSYEATQHLCTFLDTAPNEQALLFLPVFYANLDESRIPNSEQLDRILQTCGCREIIIRPMLSIETLIKLPGIPVIAYRELWPRVWSWLHFLQTYHEVLGAANETDIGVKLLALINRFISDATAAEMIYSTPGVRVLLARTWSLLLRRKEMPNAWLRDISLVLGTFDPKYSYHLEELVDGAGGTVADLASLVVIHIAGVMGPGRTPPESAIHAFGGVITFIMRLIRAREDLWPDLLAQGLATVLPTAICGLHDAHRDDMAQELLDKVLLVMLSLLRNCTDPRWCAETLEAGFFRALVLTATPARTHKHIEVKHFFHTELPKALVYRCVVSTLDLALRAAHADSIAPSFTTSPAFNDWSNFVALAEQRLEVLRDVESQECARMMGCGNMECCAIGKKADFRRCSACRKPAYCSEECQAQDWAMGHRGECARAREANLADPDPLSRRDRSFMRALLHNDYKRLRYDIYMHQLAWLHENPGSSSGFHTVFDYSKDGRASVSVHSNIDLREPHDGVRAAGCGGKMELHIIVAAEGWKVRRRVLPLYLENSERDSGLRAITQEIAHEDLADFHGALSTRVSALLEQGGEEIH